MFAQTVTRALSRLGLDQRGKETKFLGHAHPGTTLVYYEVSDARLRTVVAARIS